MKARERRLFELCLGMALLFIVGWLGGPGPGRAETGSEREPAAYEVVFSGLDAEPGLLRLLTRSSRAVAGTKRPPASLFLLQRRARDDLDHLRQALRSQGYFEASVVQEVEGSAPPFRLFFRVEPGRRYLLARPELEVTGGGEGLQTPSWEELGYRDGVGAESGLVLSMESALVRRVLVQGFPEAKVTSRQAVLDRKGGRLEVRYHLATGPQVRLGRVTLVGAEGVDPDFLQRRLPWSEGEWFHPDRLEELRKAMMGTDLFSTVRVKLAEVAGEDGAWPVTVTLTRRKERTWVASGGFSTDRGISLKGGWEHRNYFARGEWLRTELALARPSASLEVSFDKPDFHRRGQLLKMTGRLDRSEEEAYEREALEVGAAVSRMVPGVGELSVGANYALENVLELTLETWKRHGTLALPLGLKMDRSDDLLDPARGWRYASVLSPMVATLETAGNHLRWNHRGSLYHTLLKSPRLVLAGRGELGFTYGSDRDDIPVDHRFFAGGGGSLRGYGYQLASPLDAFNKPQGGRSLLTWSGEARLRVMESFGVVAFLDGGRAYASTFPDTSQEMLFGAGLGGRYITPIGPLRLDVAVPLRRRQDVDAPVQVYMSLGQAF
ncbi:MAG: outer membrane protein assembly factor [Magnetococcales bacterium]|nr:outer membrane protein assembly factor [Magnetococcales bacterium]